MPDVDGIEIIQAARRQEPGPRIIAISGGGRISAEQCLNLANAFGADAAFRKPVDLAALARSVVPAAER